ncbi:translation initiation factor IF-2-like [Felis catus]|uniref:translation initiation factor IF-2-like n=1 Tax=Felis catus TaxID=9685 RepID=UPI000C2FE8C9|nr:translation initiation factor IF-2-like [Felis catus]XP_044916925.1 translation initiation factor IF-2-like [Felis catus]XP_044916926.1 translation initiation factor IF-2-like [Felis catus]
MLTTILLHRGGAQGSGSPAVESGEGPQADSRQAISPAAPHTTLRSPTCGTCRPAPGGGWGLASHRLGPDSSGLRPRGGSPRSEPPAQPPASGEQPAAAERPAAATSTSGGGTAAEFRGRGGAAAATATTASPRGPPIGPRAWALHPAPPRRFPPRADGATSRLGHRAREPGRRRGRGAKRRRRAAPSARGATAKRAGLRFQRWPPRPSPQKGTDEVGGPRSFPPPRPRRYDAIWRLHLRDAVETKMMVFCPVAWSGPPAAIVWLPDGRSSSIFLTPNVVIRGQQRDLQGGFVCSKRAVAKRPLLNGRPAALSGDRAGDRWRFFSPHIN